MDVQIIASGSSGNAYRVSDGKTALLIDAGIPFRKLREALGFTVSGLDGCLISHAHGDHAKAAGELTKAGVDVYTSAGTIEACGLSGHHVKPVKALSAVTVGTFSVLPFDVEHDAPEPLGFLLHSTATGEKLLYFTDTYYIKYRFSGLDYIMGEVNYSNENLDEAVSDERTPVALAPRIVKSHMSLEHFLELLRANDLSRLRRVWLLHLSRNNADAARFGREVARETGAEVIVC